MVAFLLITESSITVYGEIIEPSPIEQFLITQPAPITTLLPSSTLPSKIQLISMKTSSPHFSDPLKSNLEGSAKVTPSSKRFCAAFFW